MALARVPRIRSQIQKEPESVVFSASNKFSSYYFANFQTGNQCEIRTENNVREYVARIKRTYTFGSVANSAGYTRVSEFVL